MIYLKSFRLPSEGMESSFVMQEKRTCFPTFYPFKIFPRKSLREIEFEGITMFYGGNGSGKSTLINVIARKLNALRYSDYNSAPFFEDYVGLCNVKYAKVPDQCVVLTSDDVFDYALNARSVNGSIDSRRRELVDNYVAVHHQYRRDAGIVRMKGMDDYDRWNDTMEILSPRRTQSAYIRDRVVPDVDLRSNGETAMHYFLERIEEEGLYFLDEPENSLSVEYQIQLAQFIAATARASRCQFVLATHSPVFLAMDGARIYNLDEDPVSVCKWTELPNVRRFYDFFMEHREEF
jgi:predicted ATPase